MKKGTPSPTVEPSVRVVLCGHSMGGIVAAETVIALTSDRVIPPAGSTDPNDDGDGNDGAATASDGNHTAAPAENDKTPLNSLMFPYVQAVLSFDTPYLGISPGVVAHGAESHYSTASAALAQLSTLTGLWNSATGGGANTNNNNNRQEAKKPIAALEAAAEATKPGAGNKASNASSSSSSSTWGSWGKMALYAGAGAALAGGAAAAYLKRDQITEGWTWVSSHLEFVGCLARGEDLRRRVAYMVRAHNELGIGFGNLYTRLGHGASAKKEQMAGMGGTNMVGTVLGSQRTFCNLPNKKGGPDRSGVWEEAVNDAATDETLAHMCTYFAWSSTFFELYALPLPSFTRQPLPSPPPSLSPLRFFFKKKISRSFSLTFGTQPCLNQTKILHTKNSRMTRRNSLQNGPRTTGTRAVPRLRSHNANRPAFCSH